MFAILFDFAFTKAVMLHSFFAQAAKGALCTLSDTDSNFLGFPKWWKYLEGRTDGLGSCVPYVDFRENLNSIWAIALAILELLLRLAGMIVVVYIIIAGITILISKGDPAKVKEGRGRIINATTGLAIVVVAVAAVTFFGQRLGGA